MNTRYDIYYKDDYCRLVRHDTTPNHIKNTWSLGYSFFAFPSEFIPIPKNMTKIITYYRSGYPYDTYNIYADTNPLGEFYERNTEPLNLTVSFLAYSDSVINTVPLHIFTTDTRNEVSCFITPLSYPPSFYKNYKEHPLSPIWIVTRPIEQFYCINTVCMPALKSKYNMIMKMFKNQDFKNDKKELDRTVLSIKDCLQTCKPSNEQSYDYEMPQKDPIIIP